MAYAKVSMELAVAAGTDRGEVVCVVGNVPQLGSWKPRNILPLTPQGNTNDGQEVWSRTVSLPVDYEIQYRFVKAYFYNSENEPSRNVLSAQKVMLTSWESHYTPRTLCTSGIVDAPPIVTFGHNDGVDKVDRGWLTEQTEVRLRLHSNPMQLWLRRNSQQMYSFKVTPIDLRHGEDDDEDEELLSLQPLSSDDESNHDLPIVEDAPPITVSVLRDSLMMPHAQPVFGTTYKEDDYMTFSAQTFHPDTQGYQFDVFVVHPTSDTASDTLKHIGSAYLLPMNLDQMTGLKTIPITGLQQKPIGYLKVEYLRVNTLAGDLCDLSVSYAQHWKSKRAVNIGHRGLGATYCHGTPKYSLNRSQTVKENTIASLSEAYGHGADFVEFDVQLSKDKVPVIYHELAVGLSLKTRTKDEVERFEVPIKDLKVEQLPQLKVKHLAAKPVVGDKSSSVDTNDTISLDTNDTMDDRPFPTLQQCLDRVHPNIGFNIEIKYCMPIKEGGNEQGIETFMERNGYLDVILTNVLQHAGSRRIIFSCFDPDICTMIRLKQTRYPVLFLCNDFHDKWPEFLDVRTQEVFISAAFCASEQLLGVNVATDDLLNRPELMTWIKAHGLVSFCWGHDEETNSEMSVARAKQLGVNGVIYDKIHEMSIKRSPESDFEIDHSTFGALAKGIIDRAPPDPGNGTTVAQRHPMGLSKTELSFAGKIQTFLKDDC